MNICIVGLGLIGGSIAKAIKGMGKFNNYSVYAIDKEKSVIENAIDDGAILGEGVLENSDLTILCLYPEAIVNFVRDNLDKFKPGSLIIDVCGIKEYIVEEISKFLPPHLDFLGCHPMAGKENGGYINSSADLFKGASFIMTPCKRNRPENIELVEKLATDMGFGKVVKTTPKHHDEMIAFTSQLMHVVAVALCNCPNFKNSKFYSAGSLRDCTRVAVINDIMWSELFIKNKSSLTGIIDEFISSLEEIKKAVTDEDSDALRKIMQKATKQKRKWLNE